MALPKFSHNRTEEVCENLREIEQVCKVEPMQHTPGSLNPVDIATRDQATEEHIQKNSEWFVGPGYLKQPRDTWPMLTDFLSRRDVQEQITS